MIIKSKYSSTSVCPLEVANGLDMRLRKWFHNPKRIFSPYFNSNSQILDIGCGPGFFSVALAQLIGPTGHVTAVDLQPGMLDKINKKILGTLLEQKITLHKCETNSLNLSGKFDFSFAFYVIHEISDKERLFAELKLLLKDNSKMLIVEPKVHTGKKYFTELEKIISKNGFEVIGSPPVFFSRTLLIQLKK